MKLYFDAMIRQAGNSTITHLNFAHALVERGYAETEKACESESFNDDWRKRF